jgi:hypothetical protein
MATRSFAVRQKWDGWFYLAFAIVAWFAVYKGFGPVIEKRFTGNADYEAPWVLVFHVFSFFGWLTLLTFQAALVRIGRTDLHRLTGLAGAVLVPVMVVSGLGAEYFSQHFYAARDPENARFYIIPLSAMILFAIAAPVAILLRRDPPAHKRMMLFATAILMTSAYGRWLGQPLETMFGGGALGTWAGNFAGLDAMLLVMMAYDVATRGRVHRILLIAVPVLLIVQGLIAWIYHTDWWPLAVRALLGL